MRRSPAWTPSSTSTADLAWTPPTRTRRSKPTRPIPPMRSAGECTPVPPLPRGVASSLTLPILHDERVIGSVNLYAATQDAFAGHREGLAAVLGASAECAILNADLTFSSRLAAAEAPDRVAENNEIDHALGIISANQHVDIPAARERLREAAARAGITDVQAARAARGLLLSQ